MVPTLDLMNQNLEKACCREASHLYLNISRGFLSPLKSENICLNWTVLTGMIAVLIISVFDLFFNLRKWLLARSQGDHWYYPWNQPLKDVAGEGRVEGRLGGANRTEPMQPALSTQASQILVVTPSNSAFITLHMFIQHQLYARHYTRAVKRTCMAKGLTSFRVCVCVCVCVCLFMPVCTQGVSSRPYLWASPWNIWPHGCPFSVLLGFVCSWVVSLSSMGLSHSVFLSLPNLFNI